MPTTTVTWKTPGINVTVSPDQTVTKTSGGNLWNSGITSVQETNGPDFSVEGTIEAAANKALGLMHGNFATGTHTEITYHYKVYSRKNELEIWANGAAVKTVAAYTTGQRLRVAKEGNTIKWYRNDVLEHTLTIATLPSPLRVGAAFFDSGAKWNPLTLVQPSLVTELSGTIAVDTIINATMAVMLPGVSFLAGINATATLAGDLTIPRIVPIANTTTTQIGSDTWETEPVQWTNLVNATAEPDGGIDKVTNSYLFDSGAVSVQQALDGDVYVYATTQDDRGRQIIGLSTPPNTGTTYEEIDFALYLENNGNLYVRENGVDRGILREYLDGDNFQVQVENGVVTYYHNGTLIYTSTVTPTYPLQVDCSLYSGNYAYFPLVTWATKGLETVTTSLFEARATLSGNLSVGAGAFLTGSIQANSGHVASLRALDRLAGEIPAAATIAGTLGKAADLSGSLAASSTLPPAEIEISKLAEISGTAAGLSTLAADLNKDHGLAGNVTAASTTAGLFGKIIDLTSLRTEAAEAGAWTTEPVQWINASNNVTINGGTITKNAGTTQGFDAGARSLQETSGQDTYIEAIIEIRKDTSFGFSADDTGYTETDIEYGFGMWYDQAHTLRVLADGVEVSRTTYQDTAGVPDTLRIALENGVIKWYKNGTLIYETANVHAKLFTDIAIYYPEDTLTVTWAEREAAQITQALDAVSTLSGDLLISTFNEIEGVAPAAATVAGTLQRITALAGNVAAVSVLAAEPSKAMELAGSLAAETTTAGNLAKAADLSGQTIGQAVAAGQINKDHGLTGAAAAESVTAAQLGINRSITVNITAASIVPAAFLRLAKELAGSIAAGSVAAADPSLAKQLEGNLAAGSELSGQVEAGKDFAPSQLNANSFLTGILEATKPLAGSLEVSSILEPLTLEATKPLEAEAAGSSFLEAVPSVTRNIDGTSQTAAQLAADPARSVTLESQVDNRAELLAIMETAKPIAGEIQAAAILSAEMGVLRSIAGAMAAQTSLEPLALERATELAGESVAQTTAAGEILRARTMAGEILEASSLAGTLDKALQLEGFLQAGAELVGEAARAIPLEGATTEQSSMEPLPLDAAKPLTGAIAASSSLEGRFFVAGEVWLDGRIENQSTQSGWLEASKPLQAAFEIRADVQASLLGEKPLEGSTDSQATAEATLAGAKPLAGSLASGSDFAGDLIGTKPLAGEIRAAVVLSAEPEAGKPLAGEIRSQSTAAGDLILAIPLAGAVEQGSTLSGEISRSISILAEIEAATSLLGSLDRTLEISGQIQAASSLTSEAAGALPLAGTVAVGSTTTANINNIASLAVLVEAFSLLPAADLSKAASLQGEIQESSTLEGPAGLLRAFEGLSKAETSLAGDLFITAALEFIGAIATRSELAGELQAAKPISGEIRSSSTLAAEPSKSLQLDGSLAASSTLEALPEAWRTVSGTIGAESTTAGEIETRAQIELQGSTAARAQVEGQAAAAKILAGEIRAESLAAAELIRETPMIATLQASSSLEATASRAVILLGESRSESRLEGFTGRIYLLEGATEGSSTLAGQIQKARALAGRIESQSGAAGAVLLSWSLEGNSQGRGEIAGAAVVLYGLTGDIETVSSVEGWAAILLDLTAENITAVSALIATEMINVSPPRIDVIRLAGRFKILIRLQAEFATLIQLKAQREAIEQIHLEGEADTLDELAGEHETLIRLDGDL